MRNAINGGRLKYTKITKNDITHHHILFMNVNFSHTTSMNNLFIQCFI